MLQLEVTEVPWSIPLRKHPRHLGDEFSYRWDTGKEPDSNRRDRALIQSKSKRLTYYRLRKSNRQSKY